MENPSSMNTHDASDALSLRLHNDLEKVEDLLTFYTHDGENFLTAIVSHLNQAGGKRFRPTFTLLCGYLLDGHVSSEQTAPALIKVATLVELIHLATLYHDDVMDEAQIRRGVVSANARWSNSVAILAGDFLFAKISQLIAELDIKVLRFTSEILAKLVTGQLRETVHQSDKDTVESQQYLTIIQEKTACLIGAGGYLAGYALQASEEVSRTLQNLGNNVGMAFQISDDILDLVSQDSESGKTRGKDLREGVLTLPVLYALKEGTPSSQVLQNLTRTPVDDQKKLEEVLTAIEGTKGIQRAQKDLLKYIDTSRDLLQTFENNSANILLHSLIASTEKRLS